MSRIRLAPVGLAAVLVALTGCTSGFFDFSEPCAQVTVDRSTSETRLGQDGVAQTFFVVTITENEKYGPAYAVAPEGGRWMPLQAQNGIAQVRLPEGVNTLYGSGFKDCKHYFRV